MKLDDNNVGINLGQSNLIDVDLDCALAVHFGRIWLPQNTLKLARITKNVEEITHYFYLNNKSLKDNDVKKFKGQTILENRCSGQTVVYGATTSKDDPNVMVMRKFYVDEQKPILLITRSDSEQDLCCCCNVPYNEVECWCLEAAPA